MVVLVLGHLERYLHAVVAVNNLCPTYIRASRLPRTTRPSLVVVTRTPATATNPLCGLVHRSLHHRHRHENDEPMSAYFSNGKNEQHRLMTVCQIVNCEKNHSENHDDEQRPNPEEQRQPNVLSPDAVAAGAEPSDRTPPPTFFPHQQIGYVSMSESWCRGRSGSSLGIQHKRSAATGTTSKKTSSPSFPTMGTSSLTGLPNVRIARTWTWKRRRLVPVAVLQKVVLASLLALCTLAANLVSATEDIWPLERPEGMPSIQSLEVMCGKDHMDVHLTFSHPFEGIVSSKGQHGDPRCVYVPPSTGKTFFSFRIAYARCGTKPDLHGQFYENTVVVQYDKDLLEVWDEAKRLRCEWFNDYEKTASKPPMVIADLDVIQLDFRGDNVDCWMEIQHGKGPWAPAVSGIVPLGSTLTLVVAINDHRGEFDMRVKSCAASDGGGHIIHLSDESGCVLRPKMISRFLKAKGADDRATVMTYAFFHAFKFPDALSVHIKCKVEICRNGCLDHCQAASIVPTDEGHASFYEVLQDRKDETESENNAEGNKNDGVLYDDIVQDGDGMAIFGSQGPQVMKIPSVQPQSSRQPPKYRNDYGLSDKDTIVLKPIAERQDSNRKERFPYGPRNLDDDLLPSGRATNNEMPVLGTQKLEPQPQTANDQPKRRSRSVVISDRKVRSADVGVSSLYDVISEADLAFSPDNRAEAVTVFQGRIQEEVVYGICLPVPGFSTLFVLVAVSAVVSALVAGCLLYRYQMQKEQLAQEKQHGNEVLMTPLSNWMGFKFLRVRKCPTRSAVVSAVPSKNTNSAHASTLSASTSNNSKQTETMH